MPYVDSNGKVHSYWIANSFCKNCHYTVENANNISVCPKCNAIMDIDRITGKPEEEGYMGVGGPIQI